MNCTALPAIRASVVMVLVTATSVSPALADAATPERAAHAAPSQHEAAPPPGYTETLKAALAQYDAENWQEAKALFEKAHAMFPNARTLRGLGMVAYAARRYAQARSFLLEALAHQVRPLTKDQRSAAQSTVDQCETYLAHFHVTLSPADATLLVDGEPAALDEQDHLLRLDPGDHELVARAPEYADVVRRLSVSGGQQGNVEIDLTPPHPAAPALTQATLPAAPETPAPTPAPEARRPRLWTWVALGSAVTFGGAALGVYFSAVGERDDIRNKCARMPGGGCTSTQKSTLVASSDISTKDTLATVGLALSVASAVTSGVLFFTEGRAEPPQEGVNVSFAPTAVVVHGAF